jgi:3-hydroxybutyrate dehydrogenase
MEPMQLKNRVALVTGAASGIGKCIAQTYAREGAKVVIADLNLDAGNEVAAEINSEGGVAMAVAMDVTNELSVNEGVERAIQKF